MIKGHLFESTAGEVTRLILVRHGQTTANNEGRLGSRAEIPLTGTGQQQVHLAAERLAAFAPSVLYASPQLRTRQTAEAISQRNQLELQVREELAEYSFGKISNMLLQEIEQAYPEIYAQIDRWLNVRPDEYVPRPSYPGAETMEAFVERVVQFKDYVIRAHPGRCVVAVTHLGIIKALFTELTGGDMCRNRSAFLADNASISVIDFYRGHPVIRLFNDTCHLNTPLKYGRIVLL